MKLTEIQTRLGCTLALAHAVNELIEGHAAALMQEINNLQHGSLLGTDRFGKDFS
jgi:hypothetical protein